MKTLTSASANEDCEKIILVLPDQPPTVPQMLSAWSKLGTTLHIATVQANKQGEQFAKAQESLGDKLGESS